MNILHKTVNLNTEYGLIDITQHIEQLVTEKTQMIHVFCAHTSASLCFCEGFDASVLDDLQSFTQDLVSEKRSYIHSYEGPDDMPAHIRSVFTQTSVHIPVQDGKLLLGTWQKLFLWEHRKEQKTRSLIVSLYELEK
ncbi:MAG: secondary thiamine-phosphate synthase enzyme YjbQ [Candidatus Woesearchaeota archaeon]